MFRKELFKIETLGQLKESGYRTISVKEELRQNLVDRLYNHQPTFSGIIGYDQTVIPDLQRAILSRHNIILLGLRGQAKTRIARLLVDLLDEFIPIVAGSELNDDPFAPLSRFSRDLIAEQGDDTPIEWLPREKRYTEKLATPDVSIADLLGDVDPIKAAANKLPYSDERVLHFGLIPRSHRGLFVINELPDLQARIQVALFNILQERDIQIRGFKIRLPLDIQFVFTANPEDYTNRGAIVTPLKDRIESQILTHYPQQLGEARSITEQEARIKPEVKEKVIIPELARDLVEAIAFEARKSEYIDGRSGVSARLPIAALESLVSAAERRLLLFHERSAAVRVADFIAVIPAITGKVELVYEGEVEGAGKVAHYLIGKAIRSQFTSLFPDPQKFKRHPEKSPYRHIVEWFKRDHNLEIPNDAPEAEYRTALSAIPHLEELVRKHAELEDPAELYFYMEFILHGLAEFSMLSKQLMDGGAQFQDLLSTMLNLDEEKVGHQDEEQE
jgi:magnesium chelatase subunit I